MSRKRKGISLLEMIVSIAVFAAILLALFEVFTQGYRRMRSAKTFSTAKFLAQEAIENYSYWDMVSSPPITVSKAAVDGFPDFQREVIVTYKDANLSQINVTVFWTGRSQEQNLSLSTYVSSAPY